ncbi:Gastricsin-like protein [Aphelenchoides besseyi]|nr:Gastricsin-like protein [Aphelenchoides besseyi]KAI6193423.1 Gastricsin-like protein [Aphelenchoides besseyi]
MQNLWFLSFFALIFEFTNGIRPNSRRTEMRRFESSSTKNFEFGWTFYISKNYFAQQVSVAFDLESPYTILYDANYVQTNKWPQASYYDYYQPNNSLSFKTQNVSFALDYNQDTQDTPTKVGGIWANDVVILGLEATQNRKASYYNASFGLIQSGDHFLPSDTILAYTGRLGMSLNGSEDNWVVQAFKKECDGIVTFAVVGNSYALSFGSIELPNCDLNTKLVENVVETSPQIGKQKWKIQAKSVEIGKYTYSTNQFVSFTFSTHYIVAPSQYFEKLIQQLGAYEQGDRYVVDCSKVAKAPKLSFEFNSGSLNILGTSYVEEDKEKENTECYLLIRKSTDRNNLDHWSIGSLLERSYCLSLDFTNEQVTLQPVVDDMN